MVRPFELSRPLAVAVVEEVIVVIEVDMAEAVAAIVMAIVSEEEVIVATGETVVMEVDQTEVMVETAEGTWTMLTEGWD